MWFEIAFKIIKNYFQNKKCIFISKEDIEVFRCYYSWDMYDSGNIENQIKITGLAREKLCLMNKKKKFYMSFKGKGVLYESNNNIR